MNPHPRHDPVPTRRSLGVAFALALFATVALACDRVERDAEHVRLDPGEGGMVAATAPREAGTAPPVDAATSTADATTEAATDLDPVDLALAYARCMRANGLPEWPDPLPDGRIMVTRSAGGSFGDPRRIAAMEACQALRPPGLGGSMGGTDPATAEMLLGLSRCMRENGVLDFPDPSPDGRFIVQTGFDPASPMFQAALRACGASMPAGGTLR
jgi:hypothetical protein